MLLSPNITETNELHKGKKKSLQIAYSDVDVGTLLQKECYFKPVKIKYPSVKEKKIRINLTPQASGLYIIIKILFFNTIN